MTGDILLHATTVAWGDRGLLILGPSGSGKSSLALQLMALGAGLVADDQTLLTPTGDGLVASCPPRLAGLIEARGVGLLGADPHPPVRVVLAVDLGQSETDRLPPRRSVTLAGSEVPVVHNPASGCFAAALLQYLKSGRAE